MDQAKRIGGAYIVAAILFFCAFIFLCLGLGMLFSYPDEIWLAGLLLLACCATMVYGGLSNIRLAKKIGKDSSSQILVAQGNVDPNQLPVTNNTAEPVKIFARWTYTGKEWNSFYKQEKSRRKQSATLETIVLIVMGIVLLKFLKRANWSDTIIITFGVGAIYWLGKYFLSLTSLGKSNLNEVILTSRSVIVNGKVNSFSDAQYWLRRVELNENASPAFIEFEYGWQVRGGISYETIRIPVPADKQNEARTIVNQYVIPY